MTDFDAAAGAWSRRTARRSCGYHALVFAEKSIDPGAWRKALEGWGMIRSETMRQETRIEEKRADILEWLTRRFK